MRDNEQRETQLQVNATEAGYEKALEYVEGLLKRSPVSQQIASDTMVVFEALFSLILMQGYASDTVIDLSVENRLGDLSLKLGFEGKMFNPSYDGEGGASPELRIVEGYADKVSHSYHGRYNVLRISVRATPKAFIVSCGTSYLLAIVAYLVIRMFLDVDARHALLDGYLFPIEELFGNALLMVGPPVTLLSLLKNISDVFIASERSADVARLDMRHTRSSRQLRREASPEERGDTNVHPEAFASYARERRDWLSD